MMKRRLDNPIKMRVSSGGYSANVVAHSLSEAVELFLDTKKPKSLGVLTEIKAKGWTPDDDTFYIKTTVVLKEIGRLEE